MKITRNIKFASTLVVVLFAAGGGKLHFRLHLVARGEPIPGFSTGLSGHTSRA